MDDYSFFFFRSFTPPRVFSMRALYARVSLFLSQEIWINWSDRALSYINSFANTTVSFFPQKNQTDGRGLRDLSRPLKSRRVGKSGRRTPTLDVRIGRGRCGRRLARRELLAPPSASAVLPRSLGALALAVLATWPANARDAVGAADRPEWPRARCQDPSY